MTGNPIHMGFICNRFLYTQADISVEAIFVGPLLARLCREYKLKEKMAREKFVGAMTPLDEVEIMRFGISRVVIPSDEEEEDEVEPPPRPPTFPPVPPLYVAVRSWGDMYAFQYQLHL